MGKKMQNCIVDLRAARCFFFYNSNEKTHYKFDYCDSDPLKTSTL